MLDVILGILIFLFLILGLREGIFKSLGSVAAVFFSLFLASSVVAFLAKGSPQFNDPKYLGAIIVFLVVWVFSYVVLDLLLTLLFKKIITVIVLGPVDKVG
ncbi:MAG: CvpA family protein [Candidatus Margulisbacteria bacterium]|nr:CvpA family protein [Candidatus Margulisiibacteriota bacterium]